MPQRILPPLSGAHNREWLRETSASEDKIILLVDHTLEAEPPVNTCLRFVNGEATQSAL